MKNIKNFKDFSILEYVTKNQGSNLTTNSTPDQVTFDGGDGPSAGNIEPTKRIVKKTKKLSGSNIKKKKRKKKRQIINSDINLVSSSQFGNNGQGNSAGGGGASYTLQGF